MAKYQDSALNKMKSTQASFLKDLSPVSQFPEKFDLQRILELLNTTNDINLQTKFFAALSAYLMFNQKNTNFEDIIKSSVVYDKVYNVLAKGPPRKAADALNFLSALLYLDAEEGGTTQKRTLVLFAKNMIRVSGCLGAMTNMFSDCVMYHDTWKALCHCLAIVCSDCEQNQSYCTHLVPVCIRKCNQTNIDIFLVLQSLVMNHNRNIHLFLDSNGISIFNRELLHYDKSLQLLTTVVQCSRASSLLLRETKLLDDLRDFLSLYGPGSQIGQKAKIILHHIESLPRGHEGPYNSRNITKEKHPTNIKRMDATRKVDNELDDTKTLMQNVMKEVFDYKQNGIGHFKETASTVEVNSLFQGKFPSRNRWVRHKNILNKNSKLTSQHKQKSLQRNTATELSFSIFQNQPDHGHGSYINYHRNDTMGLNFIDHSAETNKMLSSINTKKGFTDFSKTLSGEKPPVDPKEFKPIFSSTPKHVGESSYKAPLLDSPKTTMSLSRTSAQRPEIRQRTIKVQKRTPTIIERNKDKDLRNRSLSSRFFSAINGSCITLVKTVANIFKKKDSILLSGNSTGFRSSRAQDNGSCSFSFLKYMQKRDAVLTKKIPKNKNYSEFSLETKSCETCDDTEVLRKKLIRDNHLKQTVKKLKLGINLFGCDFKKISRTMWPRESYMTPVVLYNLYRKLLLK